MSKQTTKSEGKRSRVTITGSGNAVSTGKLCAPLKEIKKRRVEGGKKKRRTRILCVSWCTRASKWTTF